MVPFKRISLSVFTLSFLAISGQAFAQADVRGLANRIDALERSVGALQRTGSYGSGASAASGALSGDSYSILDRRISALENQLRDLTGQMEKNSFEIRQLAEKLEFSRKDMDVRFEEIQGGAGGGSHVAVTAPSSATTPPRPAVNTTPPRPAGGASGTPQEQYDAAFALLRNNDYAGATIALENFVAQNGKDPLAGNAMFWLAQIPYAQGQYEKAAPLFFQVYRDYPKSAKAGESLLKLGLSMAQMNKKQEACASIKRFLTEFPNASDSLRSRAEAESVNSGC